MSRRERLFAIVVLTVLGLAVLSGYAAAQQKSLAEQLLGAWTLVSIDYVRADGTRMQTFGADPKGLAMFDSRGQFVITVMRSDRPAFALKDRMKGTAEENQATTQGTMTYFGTYSVNEADRNIAIRIVSSSFPNWNGADQKRLFTITADELKLTNPVGPTGGGTTEVVFKRAQ